MSTFQSSATHERRVRQIYDSLDSGNPKKAIQEADKLLKKQKDALDAKALKALAFIRLCRFKECSEILEELENDSPTDDATLHALSLCFRELNKPNDLSRILEKACEKLASEELLTNLYFAYIRTHDFKKQYNIALLLYKLNQNNKNKRIYLHWAVVSLILQALMDNEKSKIIYLPLAYKMLSKSPVTNISNLSNPTNPSLHSHNQTSPSTFNLTFGDNKSLNEIELDLLSIILELAQNWEEALKLYTSPAGSRLRYNDIPAKEKIAQIYHKMGNYEMANQSYQELIKESPDNWNLYQKLLDTCFMIPDTETFKNYLDSFKLKKTVNQKHKTVAMIENSIKTKKCLSPPPSIMSINVIDQFLNGVIEWSQSKAPNQSLRGPYMCKLDLALRCTLLNIFYPIDSLKLFHDYLLNFSTKPCCFWDLEYFICVDAFKSSIDVPQIKQFLFQLIKEQLLIFNDTIVSTTSPTTKTMNIKETDCRLNQIYTYYKLTKYMGYFDSSSASVADNNNNNNQNRNFDERQELAKNLTQLYFKVINQENYVTGPRVSLPHSMNDQLVYVICDLLYDLWLGNARAHKFSRADDSFEYLKQALLLAEHCLNDPNSTACPITPSSSSINTTNAITNTTSYTSKSVDLEKSTTVSPQQQCNELQADDLERERDYIDLSGSVSPHLRLALIKLYYLIGAPALCVEHFHHLDAKFIQFDTLGNYLIYPAFAFAHFTSLKTCFENIIKFYENSYKNIWDYSVTVVKVNFFQIYDFVDFKRRLTFSLTHQFITVEAIILDLITEANNYEIVEEILETVSLNNIQDFIDEREKLCDNTDYYIVDSFESSQKLNYEEYISLNAHQERRWIVLRNRLLIALTLTSFLSSKSQTSSILDASFEPQSSQETPICCNSTENNNKLQMKGNNSARYGISKSFPVFFKFSELETLFKTLVLTLVDIRIQKRQIADHFRHTDAAGNRHSFQKYRLYGPFTSNLSIYEFRNGLYLSPLINAISITVIVNFLIFSPKNTNTTATTKGNNVDDVDDKRSSIDDLEHLLKDFKTKTQISADGKNEKADDSPSSSTPVTHQKQGHDFPFKEESFNNSKFYKVVEHMLFTKDNSDISNPNLSSCPIITHKKHSDKVEDDKDNSKSNKDPEFSAEKSCNNSKKDIYKIKASVKEHLNYIKSAFNSMFGFLKDENNNKLPKGRPDDSDNFESSLGFPTYFTLPVVSQNESQTTIINTDDNFIINTASKIYHLRFACETLSLTSLFLGSTYRILLPIKMRFNKKPNHKKKGSGTTANSSFHSSRIDADYPIYDIINSLCEELSKFLVYLNDQVTSSLNDIIKHIAHQLNAYFEKLNLSKESGDHVTGLPSSKLNNNNTPASSAVDPLDILKISPTTLTIFDEKIIDHLKIPTDLFSKISESYQKSFCELNKLLCTCQHYLNSLQTFKGSS